MEVSKGSPKKVGIEFLYLDLDTCTRCRGTDANLDAALGAVQTVLKASGTEVVLRKILVDSEASARRHRFVSSPTIRVNGRDIALELRETPCDSCTEACGCNGEVDCRVWRYEGREYDEAPVPLIVNAMLTEVYSGPAAADVAAHGYALPENLRRFFAAKAEKNVESCCSAEDKQSCCDASQKEACCGSTEPKEQTGCGCK